MYANAFALLLIITAAIGTSNLPCMEGQCPSGYDCDQITNSCHKASNPFCVDAFKGKGNCVQFKRSGFCRTGNPETVKKWCARTCDVC
ncbi:hypothetical protein QR680_010298 [Steinernema hermaphroditum]|uniref:ShKT domain-containing protein n=1 Tax=Steinernema hermaphroditum TaxID=289476 RepID=A0AA39MBJ0_9BILA|nr:hypothetical protein QR680_010298 [Steinernema hermaphroditum]